MTHSLADLLAMARKRGDTELAKRLAELIEKKEQTGD